MDEYTVPATLGYTQFYTFPNWNVATITTSMPTVQTVNYFNLRNFPITVLYWSLHPLPLVL